MKEAINIVTSEDSILYEPRTLKDSVPRTVKPVKAKEKTSVNGLNRDPLRDARNKIKYLNYSIYKIIRRIIIN